MADPLESLYRFDRPVVSGLMTTAEHDPDREPENQVEVTAPAAETPTRFQQSAAGMTEAQAWKGQQTPRAGTSS
jgi:hypothetical protein